MKLIKLTQNQSAIVDDNIYDELNCFNWCAVKLSGIYYAKRSPNILMHRVIMQAGNGQQIDHINHNGLDNRIHNLRFCTHAQNIYNSRKSKWAAFKGIWYCKETKKWKAEIRKDNHRYYLGRFISAVDAAKEYDKHARVLFGRFANLNFPYSKL